MKRATTISEQIQMLRERGMAVPRRRGANPAFARGATFAAVAGLYAFDRALSDTLSKHLKTVETDFRNTLAYEASNRYSRDPF